ncbi:aspartic peptidase domain-containing protein [Pseudomassariella vexata]|uniref:Aspartic peptidase domain-containing protein n=1 Tax=Pseudomassariella vexata TaxID=1141098 RepID=A0A1Y2D701_9PEZI|nr:aspartic peptidase domain-containing protein [Pseudomassariella vexata]ORY54977.1 aspartic peptidase domain-containing protein [Pseudomassariella vexata]
MKGVLPLLLAFAALYRIAANAKLQALSAKIVPRADGVVVLDLTRSTSVGGLMVDTKIGTPGQYVQLLIATDVSHNRVPSTNGEKCLDEGCAGGAFNPARSSTYRLLVEGYEETTTTNLVMNLATETVTVGNLSASNITMIVTDVREIQARPGTITLGYQAGPDNYQIGTGLLGSLVGNGLIRTQAFGIWVNDTAFGANAGSLTLGAIDTEKYYGSLSLLTAVDTEEPLTGRFRVVLSSLTATSSTGTDELASAIPFAINFKPEAYFSMLPIDLASEIWQVVGATYNASMHVALTSCRMRDSQGHLTFGFGGPQGPRITVAMRHLVVPILFFPTNLTSTSGDDLCAISVVSTGDSYEVRLGTSFLSAAYVVWDMYNKKIAVAQARWTDESNLVVFDGQAAPIPLATSPPNEMTTVPQSPTATLAAVTTKTYAAAAVVAAAKNASRFKALPLVESPTLGNLVSKHGDGEKTSWKI